MTDRPILFSGPMVRAILDGRKTQTRRVLPHQDALKVAYSPIVAGSRILNYAAEEEISRAVYAPGDHLWVRETFITGYDIDDEYGRPVGERKAWYRATDAGLAWYDPDSETTLDNPPWKPSIHMPRWASRLTLIVTDVRVQRLQSISEADAIAEGCRGYVSDDGEDGMSPREEFHDLWDSLNAKRAPWDSNPWVCAVTFTAHQCNIDKIGATQ